MPEVPKSKNATYKNLTLILRCLKVYRYLKVYQKSFVRDFPDQVKAMSNLNQFGIHKLEIFALKFPERVNSVGAFKVCLTHPNSIEFSPKHRNYSQFHSNTTGIYSAYLLYHS